MNHSQPCGRGFRRSIESFRDQLITESDNRFGPFQNDLEGPIRLNATPGWSV